MKLYIAYMGQDVGVAYLDRKDKVRAREDNAQIQSLIDYYRNTGGVEGKELLKLMNERLRGRWESNLVEKGTVP